MCSKWSSKIKHKVTLEVSLDLKTYFIYNFHSYDIKKSSILIPVVFFCPKKPRTLYSGHQVIADTFSLGTAGAH